LHICAHKEKAADRQAAQPRGHERGEQRKREDDVVEENPAVDRVKRQAEHRGEAFVARIEGNAEKGRARNAADAGIAVGDRHPVDNYQADDFAEGQSDDGEIVAAQPQHGKAKHQPPQRREHAGERQQHEAELAALRERIKTFLQTNTFAPFTEDIGPGAAPAAAAAPTIALPLLGGTPVRPEPS